MKISVITVVLNSEKTILDTLDSVAQQTYLDIEHLVVDGGSKDGTLHLVRSHSNQKIRLISEPDEGIYNAMNKGLKNISGDVVGFLNSDDYYSSPNVLAKIAKALENPKVDACYADLVYVDQDKSRIIRHWKSRPFSKNDFAIGWCPAHPTFYIRTSLIEGFGFFDESYSLAADAEFMMRYLESGQVRALYIPDTLVHMRTGGVSNKSWGNIIRQNKEIFSALKKNNISFSIFKFILRKIQSRLKQRTSRYFGWHH